MIRNGRPYTNESGIVDDTLITRHDYAELQNIDMWIRQNIRRSRYVYEYDSNSIKDELEKDTGIHLSNNEFKDAMLLAGYNPVDPNKVNWKYRIVLVKYDNPSPFIQWVKKNYFDAASPERHLARDMAANHEFPVFAEYNIIMRYYNRIEACSTTVDAFKKLWEIYERENMAEEK